MILLRVVDFSFRAFRRNNDLCAWHGAVMRLVSWVRFLCATMRGCFLLVQCVVNLLVLVEPVKVCQHVCVHSFHTSAGDDRCE